MLAAQLVRRLPTAGDLRTDGNLLRGFLEHGAEDDFAELVRRHGPLVWGVCCRALPDVADAEDAFQATFLVLVRRGCKLTGYPTIGPWLHKVAAWTARNVRRRNARRLARQSALPEHLPAARTDLDLPLDIDTALLSLPEKFRSPIVLCHLLGYSRADAALRLGCAEGTLSAWLSRGLAKLRARFGGLDPAKPLMVALAAPAALSTSVVRAAVASRVAWAASAAVSSTVSQVVEGVMRMFWIKKATALAATVFAVFAFGVGVGITGRQVESVAEGQVKGVGAAPKADASAADLDKTIAGLEKKINVLEQVHKENTSGVQYTKEKINLYRDRVADIPLTVQADDLIQLSRFEVEAAKSAAEMAALKGLLDKLKAMKAAKQKAEKPQIDKNDPGQSNIDRFQKLKEEFEQMEKEFKAKNDELDAKMRQLNTRRGHLELTTVAGDIRLGNFSFGLQEFDANAKEVGTLVIIEMTNKATMLANLLARTKADLMAPRELRLVASPSSTMRIDLIEALKACDAAGYKTVKFTGYIFGGGFATPLKMNQKGEVPGYKRYDNVESKPSELIKEIEKGRVTY